MSKRVRIALEIEENLAAEIERIVAKMNLAMAPMTLTRAAFIRDAIQDKVAKLKSQIPGL
jgi:metal-responsive CopG/Arc/MetJ family transcriptional regulator